MECCTYVCTIICSEQLSPILSGHDWHLVFLAHLAFMVSLPQNLQNTLQVLSVDEALMSHRLLFGERTTSLRNATAIVTIIWLAIATYKLVLGRMFEYSVYSNVSLIFEFKDEFQYPSQPYYKHLCTLSLHVFEAQFVQGVACFPDDRNTIFIQARHASVANWVISGRFTPMNVSIARPLSASVTSRRTLPQVMLDIKRE